ncbi:MAG: spore coat U domain-containing protein [Pseudomonadales bacterium]|nr:spore coat U domain-containing protein [Pseudomonadales bacterium]MED5433129.1 spore coat protein U domain-containing protein [Pseudomonadota bacterium]MEE2869415.1 spore coat protein U domain-containing protein [Pseudomonadota bacterium]|tara:strand:+ start:370 stop:879 length:510 start_codon:yes stop_codon:yes gene_type:complete
MKHQLKLAAIAATLVTAPLASQAATETDTFDVKLNVIGSCEINSATDMDFGSLTQAEVNAGGESATSSIGVTCSTGTTYTIALSGDNSSREMTSANNSSVDYQLFQPDGTTAWDSTTTVGGTGDGNQQDYTVNGNIPAQTMTLDTGDDAAYASSTGVDLSDTVTVTLTF